MAELKTALTHKQFAKVQRAKAKQLIEKHGCTITRCPGGYLIKSPKVHMLTIDLKYVVEGDLT